MQQDIPLRPEDSRWQSKSVEQRRREFALKAAAVGVLAAAAVGAFATADRGSSEAVASDLAPQTAISAPVAAIAPVGLVDEGDAADAEAGVDVEGEPERADGGCTIGALSLRLGASGAGVSCLQDALRVEGFFEGDVNGSFDQPTLQAAMDYQTSLDLFVDGVIGRETALALEIWPDEESLVTRTPPPAPGAKDLWGVELSPVGSAGADAPPLPEDSGSGRRVVYDRAGQRVWAVGDSGEIIRSWLVSGSTYSNELPGVHEVYSRSDMSTAWNGKAWLPQMIRWLKTERGAIGFHAIPLHVNDNSPYQTSAELGTRLSGGCQRQHNLDAAFMWEFATVGTPVIVT